MKIKLILATIIAIVICGCFYYYQSVQEITDYYRIVYTPKYGSQSPSLNVTPTEYTDTDEAIRTESGWVQQMRDGDIEKLDELKQQDMTGASEVDIRMYYAKLDLHKGRLLTEYTLMELRHTRSYNPNEYIEKMQEYGIYSKKLKEYADSKKLGVTLHPIVPNNK